jgi:hypothetical protein
MRLPVILVLAGALAASACTDSPADGPNTDSADNADGRPTLSVAEADTCTQDAWLCTFDALAEPTEAAVRTFLGNCLANTMTARGASCAPACADRGPGQATSQSEHCGALVRNIAALADEDRAGPGVCRDALASCIDDCLAAGEQPTEGDRRPPFAQCWTFGLTSTCPFHATQLEQCGGLIFPTSPGGCLGHCKATFGAWSSDVDELCAEHCAL